MTGRSAFRAEAAAAIAELVNRHRGTDAFGDADRALAVALDEAINADVDRSRGVNALIGQGIGVSGGLPGGRRPLLESHLRHEDQHGLGVERPAPLKNFDAALQLKDGAGQNGNQARELLDGLLRGLGASADERDELLKDRSAGRHSAGDRVDSGANFIGPGGHSQSPYVARVAARYVAGAFLTASRWLQRRAWVRRAVPSRAAVGHHEGGAR